MLEENQIEINANFTVNTTTEKLTGVLSVLVLTGVNLDCLLLLLLDIASIHVIATCCGDVGR